MKDRLEYFVRENRRSFDEASLPAGLWGKIEAELDKKPKKSVRMYAWMAAAASVVVVCGLAWIYGAMNRPAIEMADIDPAYARKQVHLVSQIEVKKDSLAQFSQSDPRLYKTFSEDLAKLDEEYKKLQADLPLSPNQPFVLRAMVKNREMQLQILNQQLEVIHQVNEYKSENNL